jgi:hypothetical protein
MLMKRYLLLLLFGASLGTCPPILAQTDGILGTTGWSSVYSDQVRGGVTNAPKPMTREEKGYYNAGWYDDATKSGPIVSFAYNIEDTVRLIPSSDGTSSLVYTFQTPGAYVFTNSFVGTMENTNGNGVAVRVEYVKEGVPQTLQPWTVLRAPESLYFSCTLTNVKAGDQIWLEVSSEGPNDDDWVILKPAIVPPEGNPLSPRTAKASATVVNGFVVAITVDDPGFGYTNPPPKVVVIGVGKNAEAHAVVENGMVTSIALDNAGIGYAEGAKVRIEAPPQLPTLKMYVKTVVVEMSVQMGKKYRILSTSDFIIWSPVTEVFTAEDNTLTRDFEVGSGSMYFRIVEVP